MKKREFETEYQIEKMAIASLKPEWEHLFVHDSLIYKRPYPSVFWKQVDTWVKAFRKAENQIL